jgi:hypothetical protein
LKPSNLFALTILAVSTTSALASTITYSGIQNIVLNGVPNTTQSYNILLLGSAAPTDTLRLQITDNPGFGNPYTASDLMLPGTSEVALLFGSYPTALALHLGDPYPTSPLYGSGSIIIYDVTYYPLKSSDAYYPLISETSNLSGWIHLLFNNTNSSNESITVVDWAVTTDPNLRLAMGQGAAAPEPASWLLTGSAAAAGLLSRLRYLRGK